MAEKDVADRAGGSMFQQVLIICVGNVCRSPIAEFLLRERLRDRGIQVDSAGLGAMVGYPPEGHAAALLKEHGIDASSHRARQLELSMLREADLVLAMERRHVHAATRLAPEASGKVFLLRKWLDARDVPDPHLQSRPFFERVYEQIDRGVGSWLRYL
ncbi:low molecular weight protein-tyrosine-phosphatase [Dyella sp.]|uniref:low molecular weight protein-tyrosine-phosphatase n=1 Tax=Dyella sp. TaxID=1869338 RepID=UPI002D78AD34|nr:low molecular weight protein-tyrosine-phosphatase [Dyella sp.]HET6431601.1 low molecular weight protein-tyrosine-phosphatase [Dyella sp.]